MTSNQKTYFYDQKEYYLYEISRLQKIYEKAYFKKKNYKKTINSLHVQQDEISRKYERENIYLKQKLYSEKKDTCIQTDVDLNLFIQMQKNNDLVTFYHKIVTNINIVIYKQYDLFLKILI